MAVGVPGTRCEGIVVREPFGIALESGSDSTVVGIAIDIGDQTGEEGVPIPPTWKFEGEAFIGNHLIEGNRITGADGLAIEIRRSSGNRIVDNLVAGVEPREPFPGIVANSLDPEPWREANGSGIWLSPDSDGNEILGNTLENVAEASVFLEGDDYRVERRSADDFVRDLGTGNEVTTADFAGAGGRDYRRTMASPLAAQRSW